MDQTHKTILGLSAGVFLVSLLLVTVTRKNEEFFDYSRATAAKLCSMQANYIADAPWIGGQRKRKQAYDNCMKNFYGVMPSAYVSSTFKY